MKTSTKLMAFLYTCLTIAIVIVVIDVVFKIVTVAMWIGFLVLIPFLFKIIHMIMKRKK